MSFQGEPSKRKTDVLNDDDDQRRFKKMVYSVSEAEL
jgi:hypothetical protein